MIEYIVTSMSSFYYGATGKHNFENIKTSLVKRDFLVNCNNERRRKC